MKAKSESKKRQKRGMKKQGNKTHRRNIPQLILLPSQDLPQDPPHDLATPRLGQVRNNKDRFRRGEGTDALAHLLHQVAAQLVVNLVAVLDGDEGVDGLARELIRDADHGGFADGLVLDEGGFDLGGREAVAGDVDDVVDTPADPVVAFVVAACAVASELDRRLAGIS